MNKNDIRKEIRAKREELKQDFINEASFLIFEKLIKEVEFLNSKKILSYMDFKNEVKTDKINEFIEKNNKTLILPKVISKEKMIAIENKNKGSFFKSSFGNLEPIGDEYLGKIDFIIVPGVAFDKFGNRIGFGRGYYDRFFKNYPDAKRVALAFDIQVIDKKIETDIFDEKIDMLITEKKIYKFKE